MSMWLFRFLPIGDVMLTSWIADELAVFVVVWDFEVVLIFVVVCFFVVVEVLVVA